MKFFSYLLIFLFGILWNGYSQSENEEMVTDRPDQTESAYAVPKGMVQVEAGLAFEKLNEYFQTTTQGNLIRYGVLDNLELRFGFSYQCEKVSLDGADHKYKGWNPIEAGMKVEVLQGEGFIPRLALLGGLTFPYTGARVFENEDWTGFIRVTGEWELSDQDALGFNLGPEIFEGDSPNLWFYSLVYGRSLNDQWAFFGEAYGIIGNNQKPKHLLDAGLTYLITPTLQLDVSAGLGVSDYASDFFVSMGLSWRFPK